MIQKGVIFDISKDLYYVKSDGLEYISKARGIFRKNKFSPMVGDEVNIEIFDDRTAHIVEVFERKNQILRPPVSNVDQAIVVVTLKEPSIEYKVIDRYLMYYEIVNIPVVLCLNKCDLIDEKVCLEFKHNYEKLGYDVILSGFGICFKNRFEVLCDSKISVITGPSGVGKSTILNCLNPNYNIWIGNISNKTKRGKHTTRAATLYEIFKNSFIIDTAGFTSLDITKFIENQSDIRDAFVEFSNDGSCKFSNCMHINEPNCSVKEKLKTDEFLKSRYESYIFYLNEYLKNRRY
ncbi:MAG: ribosome small subunit-dependent GTPase A [Peptoniphilaceae bacterium]|uniref:ribosome small subunit-dependent GTPase A n=1 Tax=Parvimonas sp. TaxID=1944660 RepID=UPI002A74DAD7|nr:ribosome small subunit-dependent GTPase A [Parvimonas sp.]MDD7765554.1 ribosome small subunit-dependent GTPase A [Peptoniphilaceae bacterium]MDY3051095.1 ribosome small subunit-dependent GTPase A [Parvimonas sp.]